VFLLFIALILFLFLYRFDKYKAILLSGRYSRHFYYSFVFISGFLCCLFSKGLSFFSVVPPFIGGVVLINLLFLSGLILNNLYDAKIDVTNKKPNPLTFKQNLKSTHIRFFVGLFIYSGVLAFSLSPRVFILTLCIHFIAYFYSCPPFRLKRVFILNTAVIAFATILAWLLGCACVPGADLSHLPLKFLAIIFTALTLAFNVKDVNDFKGDKQYGIATVMTVFGARLGKGISAALAFVGYILVALALGSRVFLFLSLLPATATFLAILLPKNKINEPLIFLIFFVSAATFIIFPHFIPTLFIYNIK